MRNKKNQNPIRVIRVELEYWSRFFGIGVAFLGSLLLIAGVLGFGGYL